MDGWYLVKHRKIPLTFKSSETFVSYCIATRYHNSDLDLCVYVKRWHSGTKDLSLNTDVSLVRSFAVRGLTTLSKVHGLRMVMNSSLAWIVS
jgi:hypothetical protein